MGGARNDNTPCGNCSRLKTMEALLHMGGTEFHQYSVRVAGEESARNGPAVRPSMEQQSGPQWTSGPARNGPAVRPAMDRTRRGMKPQDPARSAGKEPARNVPVVRSAMNRKEWPQGPFVCGKSSFMV